jgi:hypothetical protein
VYAIGGKHMRFDQTVQGLQNRGASTDLIGKRRQAEVDTFTGVTLPVQRLMLAELLEQDHGQQVWPCNAALCHERVPAARMANAFGHDDLKRRTCAVVGFSPTGVIDDIARVAREYLRGSSQGRPCFALKSLFLVFAGGLHTSVDECRIATHADG